MASGSRQRGGRPRKRVSGRRVDARRDHDNRLHVTTSELATSFAEGAFDAVAQITGAMECEHYAAAIAAMWDWARPVIGAEKADAIGAGVVQILGGSEHTYALAMLRGLAAVADRPISNLAYEAASFQRDEAWRPGWLDAVGRAEVRRAARVGDPASDDGTTVLFDLRWPNGQRGGMGVFMDPCLGGCAKHILVGPTLEEAIRLFEEGNDGGHQSHADLDVAEGAAIVERAMAVSDHARMPDLGETYPPLRGFVKRQLRNAQTAVPRGREAGPSVT
jgi:hypothetical protein